MLLLSNILSSFVKTFLSRSKCLLILWLQSMSAVIFEPKKINLSLFPIFPFYLPWSDGTRCHDHSFISFFNDVSSQLFHSLLSPTTRSSLVPLLFFPLEWYYLHIHGYIQSGIIYIPTDTYRGACQATVHRVTKRMIWLSNWHTHIYISEVCWYFFQQS